MATGEAVGGLWPLHLKPKNDELLSSWLIRLALAYGLKPHTFCSIAWPGKQIWNRDIDNSADLELLSVLSAKTGTDHQRVRETTLAAYEDVLYEKHNTLGPTSWILPIGIYHRIHRQFGLQYCPLCLAEDKEPYYRRKWRLAFVVCCEKHHTLLYDRCMRCGAPINFHRTQAGGQHGPIADLLTHCHICRFDVRNMRRSLITSVSSKETEFTSKLLQATSKGFLRLSPSVALYSQLFFAGLRQLMKIVSMPNSRIVALRCALNECFSTSLPVSTRKDVQEMTMGERRQLLRIVSSLLEEWPNKFIELSQKHRVWSSIWLRHLDPPARVNTLPAPFWLWSVVHDHLYRAKHSPSDEEVHAATKYLEAHGKAGNKSALARLLGVKVIRRES